MPEETQLSRTRSTNQDAAAKTRLLLETMWSRNLPIVEQRLNLLDHAAAISRTGDLSDSLRSDAITTAHKLAGSLGMFGYTHGTELARKIELLLDRPSQPGAARLPELTAQLRQSLRL